jgi:hypothetical protein
MRLIILDDPSPLFDAGKCVMVWMCHGRLPSKSVVG